MGSSNAKQTKNASKVSEAPPTLKQQISTLSRRTICIIVFLVLVILLGVAALVVSGIGLNETKETERDNNNLSKQFDQLVKEIKAQNKIYDNMFQKMQLQIDYLQLQINQTCHINCTDLVTQEEFDTTVEEITETVSLLSNDFEDLNDTVVELEQSTQTQFNIINGQIVTINGQIVTINNEITTINTALTTIEAETIVIINQIATINNELAIINSTYLVEFVFPWVITSKCAFPIINTVPFSPNYIQDNECTFPPY